MAKIDKEHNFLDQLTYIHIQYWHFLNLKSISFNFCSYTFFQLKPRYGVLLTFSWNLDHFSPKIYKEHNFFWPTNIYTYSILTFSELKINFLQLLFLHFFTIKASLGSFVEFLLKFGPFFPQKLTNLEHNCVGKLTYTILNIDIFWS